MVFISSVLNFIIGLPGLAMFMLIVAAVVAGQFYLSRILRKFTISIILFGILGNALLVANFYYNSGIKGPTLISLLLCMFLTIVIVPKKQYVIWIGINLLVVTGLLIFSYKHADAIEYTYVSDLARYFDLGYSYILVALMIFFVTSYIRSGYDKEKAIADQKAAELQSSNDTKNKLLSILAHDLRSPLSSIQSYLEILSEEEMPEEERRTIRQILLNETKGTQQMLSNLLSWSKSQMEGVQVNLSKTNLKEAASFVLRSQRAMASSKMIELQSNLNPAVNLLADKDMLQLVIRNLINNAIKFTPIGGIVTVKSKTVGHQCIVMVSDTGTGIQEEMKEGLFSLKAQSTFGTQNEKGAGLGLALCKEFTEVQNGKIWFESNKGQGTTFFLSLPIFDESVNTEIR